LVALAELSNLHEILARISRPILRKLARESGQTAHLGVLTGDMVTYLVKEQGRAAPIFTREGMKLEAYCSGIGKVLLSDLVAERLEDYLSGEPFVALTHRTLTDPEKLRREFARVRKNNFAVDNREVADDLHCIAVPVRDSRGRVVAAVSLSKLFDNSKRRKIGDDINALRKCVETIERRVWPARTDGDSKSSP
jgi:IclR family transcriptional regulator, acetate operon repressor